MITNIIEAFRDSLVTALKLVPVYRRVLAPIGEYCGMHEAAADSRSRRPHPGDEILNAAAQVFGQLR